jgi:uncharacterized protein (DUF2252 family)
VQTVRHQEQTVAERVERGRVARREVPRESHATFEPPAYRPDPVDLLEHQARVRVPELVPIRYGRMLASPFAFYRGAALIMASDLASTPRTGLHVQCCGDAHLSNFGLYASPERRLVFDINDFDETLPGPWEWDVKRLAVSMLIAARDNGFPPSDQERIVLDTVAEYRYRMEQFAGMPNLQVWYTIFEVDGLLPQLRSRVSKKMRKRLDRLVVKARSRDHLHAYAKLTRETPDGPRIVFRPPLVVGLEHFEESEERDRAQADVERLLYEYLATLPHDCRVLIGQFKLSEVARKVVGVGSVGTAAWIALFVGRDGRDPLMLQIKEAGKSVLEQFVGSSGYANAGERVVAGQRIMQATSDIFLGWLSVDESMYGDRRDYYVRQLRDWKGSIAIERMDATALGVYGTLCAATLAHAHARSGDRIAIASYLGSGNAFDRALLAFSEAYAEQNERDFAALERAVASGRVAARTDL